MNRIFEGLLSEKFTPVLCPEIFDEYQQVLSRPRFHLQPRDIFDFLTHYASISFRVHIPGNLTVVPDKADNKFLEAASITDANYMVSGDHHLLEINQFHSIPIITPAQFAVILEKF